MSRVSQRLTGTRFDLLVVGGGIHGLCAALEAALRGWSVALVERDDFGSGLSFNYQRTVHGGLRALQSGHINKAREQITERRAWAVMAPHLLRPLPFLLPTRRDFKHSRFLVGVGLRLYDRLGRAHNHDLPASLHLPPARIESPETATQLFPGLHTDGLTGAALWYDYQVRHPDRLNWLVALAAERAGARLLNHVEAIGALRDQERVGGARVRDRLTGEEYDVLAARTLICAGGSVSTVLATFGLPGTVPMLRASNLLVRRPSLELALAARGTSGRMLTATPAEGGWLIGTFQSARVVSESDTRPSALLVDAMIDDANGAFPSLKLRARDVALVQSGVTPAVRRRGRIELMPDSRILDFSRHGHPGAFAIIGVKFTTARASAERALHRMGLGGRASQPSLQITVPPQRLPHGDADGALAAIEAVSVECDVRIDDEVSAHLVDWYASEAAEVVRVGAAAGRVRRLVPGSLVLDAEIVYAVERSRAHHLADAVLRRTRLGGHGHPGRAALDAAADVMAERLGWSTETRTTEIAVVEDRYRI